MTNENTKKLVQRNADLSRELSEMKRVANKEYYAIVCKCGKTFLIRKAEAKQVQVCPFCGERPWKAVQQQLFEDE
jgi:predicted nucleic-acid-binding Zn-ribbon protein